MELIIDSESDSNSELLKNAKEAEREQQAFLEVTSVEQTYQEALIIYVDEKHDQVDRVEDKVESLIENQQAQQR